MTSPVIDAHTHVGTFGSWAQVSSTGESLVTEMNQYGVEKAIVFAPDNLLVRDTVAKYPKRLVGYVWPNPYDSPAVSLVKEALSDWGFRGVKLHPLFNA
ncbi:MAG TPA: hypothetical protein VEI80_06725, partial [Candidatus Acidoferrales bacterium]|nr:hypothetical protein [Candidatus Acidoferrales bacterium]